MRYATEVSNLGALRVAKRDDARLELASSRWTAWLGWAMCAITLSAAWWMLALSRGIASALAIGAALAATIATSERRLVFDRAAGVVIVSQRLFGIRSKAVVPLFHLRAVVVKATSTGFVAYLERRLGENIELESATRSDDLVALAKAIAGTVELRYVFIASAA